MEETPPVEETPPITVTNEGSQVFQLVNQRRKENGLAELTYRNDVQDAANIRANEIISTFSHTRPDGSSCFTAVTVNYYAIGENIASGQKKCRGSHECLDELTGTSRQYIECSIHRNGRRCCTISGRKLLGTNFYWITSPLSDSKQLV